MLRSDVFREVEAVHEEALRGRSHVDDATRRRLYEDSGEEIRQEEVTEVVGRENSVVTVDCLRFLVVPNTYKICYFLKFKHHFQCLSNRLFISL